MVAARLIFWILGASLLMGCSSTPEKTPDCNIPAPMVEIGHPVSVPEMPVPVSSMEEATIFDHEGIVRLTEIRVAAATNEKVGEENALALEARNAEVNALIECARYQNVWIQVHAEDLKDEKREHFIDNLLHRAMIALGLVVAIL